MNPSEWDCRRSGHVYPWRSGNQGRTPTPGIDVCSYCGATRTTDADGTRHFTYPTKETP